MFAGAELRLHDTRTSHFAKWSTRPSEPMDTGDAPAVRKHAFTAHRLNTNAAAANKKP